MPLDDAMDWEVMGPKYRARVIELDAEIKAKHENATIERCAQVADDLADKELDAGQVALLRRAAAAIRALKDKP